MKEAPSSNRGGPSATGARSSGASLIDRGKIGKTILNSECIRIAPFQYTALKDPTADLRLVTIAPSPDDSEAPLVLSMHTRSIPEGAYFALSYTWGDAGVTMPVLLNGKILNITRNLEIGLKRIRNLKGDVDNYGQLSPSKYGSLWIDAICINQGDIGERDQQVARMQDIYRDAAKVLVWLGDCEEPQDAELNIRIDNWRLPGLQPCSTETARTALELLVHLSCIKLRLYVFDENRVFLESVHTITDSQRKLTTEAVQDVRLWSQLARIFGRPWFQRLWIIQELGLARRAVAVWGHLTIDWHFLQSAANFILRPGIVKIPSHIGKILPLIGAHRMTQVALDAMINVDKNNILTVLHNTQGAKCTNARDRLYAILGILDDVQDVKIDYSIPVEEVYRRWAMKRIQRTKSLDILSACAGLGRSGSLPSWVPDLRMPIGQDKILWLMCHGGEISKMSRPETTATFSPDGMRLSMRGYKLDSIQAVGVAADLTFDGIAGVSRRLAQAVDTWEKWLSELCQQLDPDLLTYEIISRSFFNSTSWEKYMDYLSDCTEWRDCHRLPRLSTKARAVELISGSPFSREQRPLSAKDFERWLFPRIHGCQVFVIRSGRPGIVAANCGVTEEDEIFFLEGALTPIVLRRIGDAFRVMGPCYVNGHMGHDWHQETLHGEKLEKVVLV